jgi:DNA invertase Pin-like site-specific DNA recombinase
MKYGYARVSTDDQSTALQLAALKRAGCKTLFKDEGLSGATTKRPALLQFDRDGGWRLPVRARRTERQED